MLHLVRSEDHDEARSPGSEVRKDHNFPSDRTMQSVSNSVRFAVGSQRKVLFQVTLRYLELHGVVWATLDRTILLLKQNIFQSLL